MIRLVKVRAVVLGILVLLSGMTYVTVVGIPRSRPYAQVALPVARQSGVAVTARAFAHVSGGRLDRTRSLNVLSMAVLQYPKAG